MLWWAVHQQMNLVVFAAARCKHGERAVSIGGALLVVLAGGAAEPYFLGQQKVFPVSFHGAKGWFAPAFLPLKLMIFWLLRVWFTKEYKRTASPYQAPEGLFALHKQIL